MSKAQYDIFVGKVKSLARTLVIKSAATADTINAELLLLGYTINSADPTGWKYYLNLAGQYHSSDTPMTVTSLDTLQTIDFTVANLHIHEATAQEYVYGSRYYNELVSRYPEQELLIRGILNPVDATAAIAADDGTILWFDPTLVESNETNLIPNLQLWINGFITRWNVGAYTLTDDLYAASFLAVLYMLIPGVILSLRLANCHTPYVHSYHVKEFLASHGQLDAYVDNLTIEQKLWLYRNIRYIERNPGAQATFQWLVENILTKRGLPLVGWSMRHDLKDMVPDQIYPTIEYVREPINYGVSSAGVDTRNTFELLMAEANIARGNLAAEEDDEAAIERSMKTSFSDRLQTKVLESSVFDLTDASLFPLSDCLLYHWFYLAYIGRYSAVAVVDNPHTGDNYTFNMLEGFVVFMYAFNKARGVTLTYLPKLEAIHVRRIPTPTRAQLSKLVEKRLVPDAVITAALAVAPNVANNYISRAAFNAGVTAIHTGVMAHRWLYATQEHYVARGQVEQMVGRFYEDHPCDLGTSTTYASWFAARGLDIPTLSASECDLLANQLLQVCTGTDLHVSQSLKDMQAAMLRIMTQLSSYAVQYLQEINTDQIRVPDSPIIRVGDDHVFGRDVLNIDQAESGLVSLDVLGKGVWDIDLADWGIEPEIRSKYLFSESIDPTVDFGGSTYVSLHDYMTIANVGVLSFEGPASEVADVTTTATNDYSPMSLVDLHQAFTSTVSTAYTLTASNRASLASRWAAWASLHPIDGA